MPRISKGLTGSGRPVLSREERGYVIDIDHIERLLKAVIRDTRIPLALANDIEDHGRAIIHELRPYIKGTVGPKPIAVQPAVTLPGPVKKRTKKKSKGRKK